MLRALLISECLQNDFVRPIGRYDRLPNLLHVGHEEAHRLIGEDPSEGPLAQAMRWVYAQPAEELGLIQIRDWHDAEDPAQASHLGQFGPHCLRGTPGAELAFPEPDAARGRATIVDALTLNDFQGTELASHLDPHAASPLRVGLIGVWTEAKVSFLAYELATRYPRFQLAVCSALTASSSRARHFLALDQLERLLGVRVHDSLGQFLEFLGGRPAALPLHGFSAKHPELSLQGGSLAPDDTRLVRHLFRGCREVKLRSLDGGFSGNLVLGSESVDLLGHREVPHVVKIGPRDPIARERTAFERVQAVLGNNAPAVTDFADAGERGAIKYRYASLGGFATTFQKLYQGGLEPVGVERILRLVFEEQLGRLYAAASFERCDLLDYYGFRPEWAPRVRARVEALAPCPLLGPGGRELPPLALFYEHELEALESRPPDYCFFSYLHGDLNGANIIVDGQQNVWLIDFFHTHRGHVLRDLIKLENDLLYIFTPLATEAELEEATRLAELLLSVEDLAAPLPAPRAYDLRLPALCRAHQTILLLRSFYPALVRHDRDPLQLLIGQLRYAAHTLSFDESTPLQRRFALYTATRCAEELGRRVRRTGPLRVDWLDRERTAPGRVGVTILPGRRDTGRSLPADLEALRGQGVSHVLCLLAPDELARYGVESLLSEYAAAGFGLHHLPILDGGVPTPEELTRALGWIEAALAGGGGVLIHCVGGLGRSGTVAACWLRSRGASAEDAIAEVRRVRTPRAIETAEQEAFVRESSAQSC
jgi:protein-tyrosine phosphatase/nicotinamidase-related amidase